MGNRSSKTSSTSSSAEDLEGGGSGLYLTPELQAKINADFDSHIIQTEWDKYRTLHLQRHQKRETSSSLRHAELQEQTSALRSQAKAVHDKLDEMVDAAQSKLVDLEVEVGYDVNRLSTKFEGRGSSGSKEGKKGECLDVRAELTHCYNTLKDGGECMVFARKLDKCVTEALASP
mmetsp:Transcript_248/g.363  ORF Transcript_248/g.363 Transcript_248/m.363 type:complete len:175 (-) Transcript_248:481-1005(-)|eukprot:CAMPEP_0196142604 /NCGR_PEP_ID=MMETSP0910-20130528/11891_1 /TAXON_ID=49265 /ORGANISM="Thalassiosira rotula, Strain GSO102" /LENGTH=174 /DNA_ID=CAMNT_0041403939 /DNA_START=41 /DNA_END=565 /DNA_ORIENTATION=+